MEARKTKSGITDGGWMPDTRCPAWIMYVMWVCLSGYGRRRTHSLFFTSHFRIVILSEAKDLCPGAIARMQHDPTSDFFVRSEG